MEIAALLDNNHGNTSSQYEPADENDEEERQIPSKDNIKLRSILKKTPKIIPIEPITDEILVDPRLYRKAFRKINLNPEMNSQRNDPLPRCYPGDTSALRR
jgi:hypothetical protein